MRYLADEYDVAAVCSPGDEHEAFRRQGLTTYAIPVARRMALLRDIISFGRLFRLFREKRPDIVHTMTPKAGLLGMMAAWAAGVPVRIATFNGELNLPNRFTRVIIRITNALTCYFATHLNADGFGTRQYIINQNITKKPVTVFHKGNINGIDLTRFTPTGKREQMRASLGIAPSTLVYMFVGRMVHDKGIDELVEAFVELKARGLDIALILIGAEEPQLDPIAATTRRTISSTAGIYALGRQSNVPDWLEAADVFVLPSHREGCNCSLLEGCAMGLPSIATDILGCRDIIRDGVNGILYPPKDREGLMEAMQRLYASPELRHQLASQCRAFVENNFDRRDVWREMRAFYASQAPALTQRASHGQHEETP